MKPGEVFYIVEAGEVRAAGGGVPVRDLGPGDFFGEIALLRSLPRTATVTAIGRVALRTLGRDEFVAAVTGHAPSAAAADAVVESRLGVRGPDGFA